MPANDSGRLRGIRLAHMKLTIRNLQYGDFGNYRCISKNSLGETEGSIRVYEIPLPSTPSKQVTHSTIDTRENSIIPIRNDSTRSLQTDVTIVKNELLGSGSSSSSATSSLSSSNSATSSISSISGNSIPGFSSSGNAIERKGSLAIGKSMFYTEHPPNQLADTAALTSKPTKALVVCAHLLVFLLLRCRA